MRRGGRRTPIWLSWSYSKLRALHECPLKFWYQYVERRSAPQAPILTVGAALHYLAFRFFRVRYKSPESFVGAWKHFWLGVANGEHGPGGHHEQPVEIAWKYEAERWYWMNEGAKLLARFYERHADDRGTGIARLAEVRFRLANWRGFTLNGVIDRVDEFDDHVIITDYKMGLYPPYMLGVHGSAQPIFYKLAYETQLAKKVGHKPLHGMRVENLFSGAGQNFVLGGPDVVEEFFQHLLQASNYVRSIMTNWTPPRHEQPKIIRFPVDQAGKYHLWPRLPRDPGHCSTCSFHDACEQWEDTHVERGELPDATRLWRALEAARERAKQPTQLLLFRPEE